MGNLYKEGNLQKDKCAFCQKQKSTQYRNWINVLFSKHSNRQIWFCCNKHYWKWLIMLKYICTPTQFKNMYVDNIHIIDDDKGPKFFNCYTIEDARKYTTGKLKYDIESELMEDIDTIEHNNDILQYISTYIKQIY